MKHTIGEIKEGEQVWMYIPRFEFEFVFHKGEPGWNKNTAQNIYQMQDDIKKGTRKENKVDYNSVPEKYQKIVEEHKQLPLKHYKE